MAAKHTEKGMAWNDPEIGFEWPQFVGIYSGSAVLMDICWKMVLR